MLARKDKVMSLNIFTSQQVGAWLIYEGKKYRDAVAAVESSEELDVIIGGEHAMFGAAKRLYANIGVNFVDALTNSKLDETAAKSINLIVGDVVGKDDNFVNCEEDVLGLICKMTAEAFFDSLSCQPNSRPYHMGRCVALGHFADELCFQLGIDVFERLYEQNIPTDIVKMITGFQEK